VRVPIRNDAAFVVAACWPSFATGLRPEHHGYHGWATLVPGSYDVRDLGPEDVRGTPFWEVLSAAGRRVAIVDVPRSRCATALQGLQVVEWGSHDRLGGLRTTPPALRADLEARHGLHPVAGIDPDAARVFAPSDHVHRRGAWRDAVETEALVRDELRGLARKTALSLDLLARERWDCFVSVFGEGHSVGHQAWHQHDAGHPRHDAAARASDGDPIARVYRALDAAVAAHVAHVGTDTTLLVLLSHGMGAAYDAGGDLLERVLQRLAASGRIPHATPGPLRRAWQRLRRPPDATPPPWFIVPSNDAAPAVRLNVRGREPDGTIDAAAAPVVRDALAAALAALRDVETGEPVADVLRPGDGRTVDDARPDLIVAYRRSRPLRAVWSAATGEVTVRAGGWRSGEHRPDGLLLATGPGLPSAVLPAVAIEDVAPTIAALAGITPPPSDGVPCMLGRC
jgi:predicted AlkP superfamily phosphohydrolase/phosphomutase